MRRRHVLAMLGGGAAALAAGGLHGFRRLARAAPPDGPLSAQAEALVARAFEGLDPRRVLDTHVHVVGLGAGGTGCYVNDAMRSPLRHPVRSLKFGLYKIAAGVSDEENGDREYRDRLVALARGLRGGRCLLLAFDQARGDDGAPRPDLSEFYTPNDYVLSLARAHPDLFVPAVSIHPRRPDALEELDRCAEAGAIAVKWLPNAQRIDPSAPACEAFYERMASLGLTLLSHGGEEQAVEAEDAQRLGNPLHLRRALDRGVRVVLCHSASLGENPDLDRGADAGPWVSNFELYLRLMGEERHRGRLFGDVSALVQFNRCGEPLARTLERQDLHPRLVNGSDYPLPAINALVRTGTLEAGGYIDAEERRLLNEIDLHNPLLFDFVLKRSLKRDRALSLAPSIFTPGRDVFPRLQLA